MASDSYEDSRSQLLPQGAFEAALETELKRAMRAQNFVTLVVLEMRREWEGLILSADDGTLAELADVVRREVRDTDVVGQSGSGLLSLLLLDADFEHSTRVVDRVMGRVDDYDFTRPLHIAVGAACYPTHAVDAGSLRRQARARSIVNWSGGHDSREERS
jgi:GGDEF domain-containing protein